jgi:hypothetical protein
MLGRAAEAVTRGEPGEGFVVMNVAGYRIEDRLEHDAEVAPRDDPFQPLDRLDRLFGELGKRPRCPAQCGCRIRSLEAIDDVDDALGDFLGPEDLTVDLEARPLDGEVVRLRIAVANEGDDLFLQPTDVELASMQEAEAI